MAVKSCKMCVACGFAKTGSYGRATAYAAICEEAFAHNRRQSAAIIATPAGASVRILSVDGRELFRSVVTEQGALSIDIARFPSGIYLLSTPGSTIKFLKP